MSNGVEFGVAAHSSSGGGTGRVCLQFDKPANKSAHHKTLEAMRAQVLIIRANLMTLPRCDCELAVKFFRSLDTETLFQNQKKFASAKLLSRTSEEQCLTEEQKAFFAARFNLIATAKSLIK